jgi:hypothetical protein
MTHFSDPPSSLSYTWDLTLFMRAAAAGNALAWLRRKNHDHGVELKREALFAALSPLIAENTPQTRGGSCRLFILWLSWLAPEHIHMHFTFTRMMFRSCVEHGTSR